MVNQLDQVRSGQECEAHPITKQSGKMYTCLQGLVLWWKGEGIEIAAHCFIWKPAIE
jgi:hypothetical protein